MGTAYKLLDFGIKSRKISPKYKETWFRDEGFAGIGERKLKGIMGRKLKPKVTKLRELYEEYDVMFI